MLVQSKETEMSRYERTIHDMECMLSPEAAVRHSRESKKNWKIIKAKGKFKNKETVIWQAYHIPSKMTYQTFINENHAKDFEKDTLEDTIIANWNRISKLRKTMIWC